MFSRLKSSHPPNLTGTFSRFRFVPALLVLALALLFSGCNDIQHLLGELYGVDDGPAGNGAGEGGNAEPAPLPSGYVATGELVYGAQNMPSIK